MIQAEIDGMLMLHLIETDAEKKQLIEAELRGLQILKDLCRRNKN